MKYRRSLNEHDVSKTKVPIGDHQDPKKVKKSTIFNIFSGFSNSIFSNPYIIGLVTVVITSLFGEHNFYFEMHWVSKIKIIFNKTFEFNFQFTVMDFHLIINLILWLKVSLSIALNNFFHFGHCNTVLRASLNLFRRN